MEPSEFSKPSEPGLPLLLESRIRNRPKPAQLAPHIGLRPLIAFCCWRKTRKNGRTKTFAQNSPIQCSNLLPRNSFHVPSQPTEPASWPRLHPFPSVPDVLHCYQVEQTGQSVVECSSQLHLCANENCRHSEKMLWLPAKVVQVKLLKRTPMRVYGEDANVSESRQQSGKSSN